MRHSSSDNIPLPPLRDRAITLGAQSRAAMGIIAYVLLRARLYSKRRANSASDPTYRNERAASIGAEQPRLACAEGNQIGARGWMFIFDVHNHGGPMPNVIRADMLNAGKVV